MNSPVTSRIRARRRELWLIALLTLAAFALRMHDLTGRSLWLDEGFTLARVFGEWPDLLRNAVLYDGVRSIDTQPQAYFALLKLWISLVGTSEFALRLFSAFAGVASVPLVYALTRRTLGRRAGALAALLMLLSPVLQWYSHEVRMYSLVVALSALSIYLLRRWLLDAGLAARTRLGLMLAWLAATAAAALTHYSFIGMLVAQAGAIALALGAVPRWRAFVRRHARPLLALGAAMLVTAIALAIVIDLPFQVQRLLGGAESTYAFVPLQTVVQSIFSGALFGMNAVDPSAGAVTWLAAIVCAFGTGLWWWRRPARRADVALLMTCAALPVLVWFALSFVKPNYHGVRHLILALPPIAAVLAGAIDILWAWPRPAAEPADAARGPGPRAAGIVAAASLFVLILGAQAYGLLSAFTRTPDWQDDWRSLSAHIRARWQPGDAALETAGTPERIPSLYLGDLPLQTTRLSAFQGMPPAEAAARIAAQHPRVWFINTGGREIAEGEAGSLLGSFYVRERVRFPGRTNTLEVALIETRAPITDALPATAAPVAGGEALPARLAGYELLPGSPHAGRPNARLALYWQRNSASALDENVRASLQLRHGDTTWWDWTVPVDLKSAPEGWDPGRFFRTDHVIPLPLGLPALPYTIGLTVRMQAKDDVLQADVREATPAQVACCLRWPSLPGVGQREIWRGADAALAEAEYPDVLRPGQPLPVALTWRKLAPEAPGWDTRITLSGVLGGEVATSAAPAGDPAFPVAAWPAGEAVRDVRALQVPFTTAPGVYRLSLERMRDGARVDGADLGFVRMEDYPRTPVAGAIEHPVDAAAGDIALLGYSFDETVERGRPLDFVTHWRVERAPQRDGVLFLHVVDANGQLVSQDDNPPDGGKRSTLTYRAGDGIDQVHRIVLKPELPSGEYRLLAGIYDREGGARWPARQSGQPALNDLVELGAITVP